MADDKQDIEVFLKQYHDIFQVFPDRSKVLCKLTKHELPLNLNNLSTYVQSKKFQRLYSKLKFPEKIFCKIEEKYKEYFTPSKKSKSRVYCMLTRKEVNKLPHEIEKYITGYKFQKALYLRREEEKKGVETFPLEEQAETETENVEEDVPFYAISDTEDDINKNEDNAAGSSTKEEFEKMELNENTSLKENTENIDNDDIAVVKTKEILKRKQNNKSGKKKSKKLKIER